ncbi:MAG: hypothetical protein LBU86_07615 [Oscillospiraceae bacterium]|jgi:TRAP-type C4-dicarboxylate transport system substrate-binding protein|nr:hypothetical protein [Oscillospiraceae bacterium]
MARGITGILAFIIAIIAIFTGCADHAYLAPSPETPIEGQPAPEPAPRPGSQDIVFAISRDADDILREAAEYFCGEYTRLSGGSAQIMDAIAPDTDLLAGRAQVAFLNKKRQYEFNELLMATSTPFLYSSYQNFALSTGAGETTRLLGASLREQSGLVPLGAFYQGALHIITDFPVSGYQQLESVTFAVSDDSEVRGVVERLNAVTITADTDGERLALYMEGEVSAAEVSLKYAASAAEFEKPSYITESYHNLIPVWLIAEEDFYEGLGDEVRAELMETVAVLNYMIDSACLSAEAAAKEALIRTGNIVLSNEFASVRNRVFNTAVPLSEEAGVQQKLARDLITAIRQIG